MLNNLKKKTNNEQGFTIIEVMIVLAIAGLIILIVLLAVPALQRNGRNTALKNDASAIVAGISEFSSNNDGKRPAAATSTPLNGVYTFLNAATDTPATAKYQASTDITQRPDSTVAAVTPTAGTLIVTFGTKCPDPVPSGAVTVAANPRSSTVIYAVESASAVSSRCIDS